MMFGKDITFLIFERKLLIKIGTHFDMIYMSTIIP